MGTCKVSYSLLPKSEQKQRSSLNCKDNAKKGQKPIKCLNNEIIYPSIVIAAQELGLDRQTISRVLKGKCKNTKGFSFEYADKKEGMLDDKDLYSYTFY